VASELLALSHGLGAAQDQRGSTTKLQISQDASRCDVLEAFGADTSNYVFDIYCLDDADESNEESESRVTSRLRWNCRAALGTGMRRRSTYLGISLPLAKVAMMRTKTMTIQRRKAQRRERLPGRRHGAWLTTTKRKIDLTTLFECDPRNTKTLLRGMTTTAKKRRST
jgi:hypothetical protein